MYRATRSAHRSKQSSLAFPLITNPEPHASEIWKSCTIRVLPPPRSRFFLHSLRNSRKNSALSAFFLPPPRSYTSQPLCPRTEQNVCSVVGLAVKRNIPCCCCTQSAPIKLTTTTMLTAAENTASTTKTTPPPPTPPSLQVPVRVRTPVLRHVRPPVLQLYGPVARIPQDAQPKERHCRRRHGCSKSRLLLERQQWRRRRHATGGKRSR